jgi:hypothetical protein
LTIKTPKRTCGEKRKTLTISHCSEASLQEKKERSGKSPAVLHSGGRIHSS